MRALGYMFLLFVFIGCWIVWQILRRASAGVQAIIDPERYAIQKVVDMQQEVVRPKLPLRALPEHSERWNVLVRFDPDVAAAADELRPCGAKWIEELGRAYAALNEDKKILPNIVRRLKSEAQEELNKEWANKFTRLHKGENCRNSSLQILRRAAAQGYRLAVKDGEIAATKPGSGTTFLRSNSDIERFSTHL
jgi:hypothetical protein